ncbi:UbiA prenyltransferase, putative [Trichoderma parareesei]|uniref:UbiA prenyltransferase, putative n=1 Tax=Trichoderma parareesei TaxID=858221 RepID=A0A2H2ZC08_TRIPA|nr:UbiA prenyltransferase, putative [Trichoderma parareesei]
MGKDVLLEKGVTTTDADVGQILNVSKRSPFYQLKTLFLFTKSDFKTVIVPQSIFAATAALSKTQLTTAGPEGPDATKSWDVVSRVPLMLSWLWLNLLVEDIANQRLEGAMIEDAVNKPWRPLPSRRLTPEQARDWLIISIMAAIGLSAFFGGYSASITLMVLIWMYNDLEGSSSGIWIRNALNAGGLMCFSWGALATLSGGELLPRGFAWILVTGAVIMTTVHAQDLPDIEGDMARGRLTMPLTYGETAARASLAAMVMFWSVTCPLFWDASLWGWAASTGIGSTMSVLALQKRGQRWDEVVWKLWCLWITVLYMLPAMEK